MLVPYLTLTKKASTGNSSSKFGITVQLVKYEMRTKENEEG